MVAQLQLLGALRLSLEGREVALPSSRKARLLLAMLAVDRRVHGRSELAGRLWPDVREDSARVSLRTALVQLRAALGGAADSIVQAGRHGVALAPEVRTDIDDIEELVAAGAPEAALDRCRGELLAGFDEDWVHERRDHLRADLAAALGDAATAAEAAGDLDAAVRLTRRQTGLDALAEAPHRDLIRRLAAADDRGAALAAYDRLRERLAADLRIAPSTATRRLVDEIRTEQPADGRAPVAAAGSKSAGTVQRLDSETEGIPLRIQLLGGFAVSLAGRPVPERAWRLRKAKSLIKLLALASGHRANRSELAEMLWPERSQASVANNFNQALHVARRALELCGAEGAAFLSASDGLLMLREPLWIDLEAFEAAAARARERRSPDALRAALELHTGELLPEDRYEDWTAARREAVRELHLGLLVELAELHVAAGEPGAAIEALQRATVEDPLHESAHRGLMRLFATGGRRQQALAQYQRLRHALRRELEADPDPATRSLYQEILSGRHEAAAFAPAAASDTRPVRAPRPQPPPSNLPAALTSFVGRERELADLDRRLGRTRVLTLTGPGGCGKTRLALELAAATRHRFEHGTWLVELASISDAGLVVPETAAALGMQLRSQREPSEVLAEQLGERRLLLLLDNCEHVIDACARLAERLQRGCPNLAILATSREPLRIPGEHTWWVPSLSLPDPVRRPTASEAVRLFCQRAADAAPGFALTDEHASAVAEICLRLDGMPLAIELAAARAGLLSPAQIADRLGDSLALLRGGSRAALTRQQTLHATLTWSHDLLTGSERTLFRRLAVFAGTFDIDAVERVCAGDGIERSEIVDLLGRLVDKSLVQCAQYRYRLLETVRQYGRERLREAGEADRAESAHRACYQARAVVSEATASPEALELDHDDLRSALSSALTHDPPAALRIATALQWFWMARGHFAEGARWLAEALAAAPEPTALRARALLAACALDVRRGAPQRIVELGGESVEISRRLGDRLALASALEELGMLQVVRNEFEPARRTLDTSIELGDAAVAAAVRQGQGAIAYCQGDYAGARELLSAGMELLSGVPDERGKPFRATHPNPVVTLEGPAGSPRAAFEDTMHTFRPISGRAAAAYMSLNVGEAWRAEAAYEPARNALEQALGAFQDLRDTTGTAVALNALGNLARSTGELEVGADFLNEALAIRRRLGDRRDIGMSLASLGLLTASAGDVEGARRAIREALAIFEETEDGPGLAGMWQDLGRVELEAGDPARASELLERSARLWQGQLVVRAAGWSAALLVEAAEAAGDAARARRALQQAVGAFRHVGEARGLALTDALAANGALIGRS